MSEQGRVQKGIAGAGQWTAVEHSDTRIALGIGTPESRRHEIAAMIEHTVASRKAKMGPLRDRLKALEAEDARIGAAKAAVEIHKEFPTAGSMDFIWLQTGVAMWKDIRDREGSVLVSRQDIEPFSDARLTADTAVGHLATISVQDLSNQGVVPTDSTGTSHRVNLDNALELAVARLEPEAGPAAESAERAADALAIWDQGDGPQTTFRDMFADMRHAADAAGVDLHEALDESYQVYLHEKNDSAFREGL